MTVWHINLQNETACSRVDAQYPVLTALWQLQRHTGGEYAVVGLLFRDGGTNKLTNQLASLVTTL